MRKKLISFLTALIMLITLLGSQLSAFAADSGINVQFNNGGTGTTSNTINAKFKVTNTGTAALNLSSLKLRYYYTADADKAQSFWCDHSGMMNGWNYVDVTSKVTGTFGTPTQKTSTADSFFDVGFKSDAGSLPAGGTIEVQTRIARNDWTNYDQSNDYSYTLAGSNVDWNKVTGYINGALAFGVEPVGGQQNPSINPTSADFDKKTPADVTVTLTPNGNTFKGITELTSSQYTVSGNTVKILSSYLNTLTTNTTKSLTFDFGVAYKPVLNVAIKDTTTTINPTINPTTNTFKKGLATDLTVTLTPNGKTFVGITEIASTNYTISGNTVIIKSSYLNTLAVGTTALTFNFGVANNPKLTLIVTDPGSTEGLGVKIGTAAGKVGETVTIPVTFADVAKAGNVGTCNFYVDYDASLLEATAVAAGPIVSNAAVNFSSLINSTDGTISFLFLDNTIGSELIKADGVFANITFKIKSTTAAVTTPVVFSDGGSFGNGTMAKIATVNKTNGSVAITLPIEEGLGVKIGTAAGIAGESVTIPVTFADVAKAGNVGTCNFYVDYDASLLEATTVAAGSIVSNAAVNFSSLINSTDGTISFLFLDNTIGNELIKADGIFANITFKLKSTPAVVTTPVVFSDGGSFGNGTMAKIATVNKTNGSVTINPGDIIAPTINPTTNSFVQGTATDLTVTLTPNGNTFKGITELASANYTVSGNTVKILSSYLNTLTAGTTALTFDFGVAALNPKLTITVTPKPIEGALGVKIDAVAGNAGETVTVPVTFADVAKAGSVGTCNFYVDYDASLLEATAVAAGSIVSNAAVNFSSLINSTDGTISFLFLDNTIGSELIKTDGVFANITFKLKSTTTEVTTPVVFSDGGSFGNGTMAKIATVNKTNGSVTITPGVILGLGVKIGTAAGKAGESVTVPVTFADVAKAGNIGTCNFYVDYDASLLEATSVAAGSIVSNAAVNFSSLINSTDGTISFLFLDNTIGNELIKADGVFANITFKLKSTPAAVTTPVVFSEGGSFGSGTMAKIATVNKTNGSVDIAVGDVIAPTIDTTTKSFEQGKATDLTVTLTPNGNTFKGITGLTQGSQYTKSGDTVTILSSYLNTLVAGATTVLTFDFGVTNNPKLTITVTEPIIITGLGVKIGTAAGKAGETVTVPVTFADVAKAGNVGTCNFYVDYDASLLEATAVAAGSIVTNAASNFSSLINSTDGTISFLFLDNTIGDQLINTDGIFANITFKLKSTTTDTTTAVVFSEGGSFGNGSMAKIATVNKTNGNVAITAGAPVITGFGATIGTATGTVGQTITVPITLANVAKSGNVGTCNFYVGYDASLLEAVSVTAGNIVTSPASNFASLIKSAEGNISFLFLDNTVGSQLITADGVLGTITFKVIGTSSTTTPITFNAGGAFGNGDFGKITDITFVDGSAKIN